MKRSFGLINWVDNVNYPSQSAAQTIAAFQHNISQQCWPIICKLRPNHRDIWTPATYSNIVRRIMLCAFGHRVGTSVSRRVGCWWLKYLTIFKLEPTAPLNPGRTIATCQRNIVGRNMLCAFGHRFAMYFWLTCEESLGFVHYVIEKNFHQNRVMYCLSN